MAWVYILKLKSGQYYVGSTSSLSRRLAQHGRRYTKTTARLRIDALVLKQKYDSLQDARSVERKIKNLKRKDYIEKMVREEYIKIQP
jgi:predicted GIY-YIG superfamily endonuclease